MATSIPEWKEPKDPDETLDYQIDWSDRLEALTINTVTWILPDGLTKIGQDETQTVAKIWLSGGTLGETYEVLCRITTSGGVYPLTMDQTVKLRCTKK